MHDDEKISEFALGWSAAHRYLS